MRGTGGLPVNLRWLLDGEEEMGSPQPRRLPATAARPVAHRRRRHLRHPDGGAPGRPAVTVGLRGLLKPEVEVCGPRADLHAGTFGGAVHNPARRWPTWSPGCTTRTAGWRSRASTTGFGPGAGPSGPCWPRPAPADDAVRRQAGSSGDGANQGGACTSGRRCGRRSRSTASPGGTGAREQERRSRLARRPSSASGWSPTSDPPRWRDLLRKHLARTTPATVRATLRTGSRVPPAVFDTRSPAMAAVGRACLRGFGARPVPLFSGGTIPAAGLLQSCLRVPVVLLGLALPDDGAHAPNERFHLPTLWSGIDTLVWLLAELGACDGHARQVSRRASLGRATPVRTRSFL